MVGEASQSRSIDERGRGRRIARWPAGGCGWLIVVALSAGISTPLRSVAQAQNADVDRATSDALTANLKQHQLPLVGAQVVNDSAGGRQVVLYGFVASDAGKVEAEERALNYLGSPPPSVDDRIVVKPELANMTEPSQQEPDTQSAPGDQAGADSQVGQAVGGSLSFDSLYDQIQRYGIKSPPGE